MTAGLFVAIGAAGAIACAYAPVPQWVSVPLLFLVLGALDMHDINAARRSR